jgi:hypothetical protein
MFFSGLVSRVSLKPVKVPFSKPNEPPIPIALPILKNDISILPLVSPCPSGMTNCEPGDFKIAGSKLRNGEFNVVFVSFK